MIPVREGQQRILDHIAAAVPPEVVPVTRALARVLAGDVTAPFDVPPADNSAVDGYAVSSADIPPAGLRELDVVGDRRRAPCSPRRCAPVRRCAS